MTEPNRIPARRWSAVSAPAVAALIATLTAWSAAAMRWSATVPRRSVTVSRWLVARADRLAVALATATTGTTDRIARPGGGAGRPTRLDRAATAVAAATGRAAARMDRLAAAPRRGLDRIADRTGAGTSGAIAEIAARAERATRAPRWRAARAAGRVSAWGGRFGHTRAGRLGRRGIGAAGRRFNAALDVTAAATRAPRRRIAGITAGPWLRLAAITAGPRRWLAGRTSPVTATAMVSAGLLLVIGLTLAVRSAPADLPAAGAATLAQPGPAATVTLSPGAAPSPAGAPALAAPSAPISLAPGKAQLLQREINEAVPGKQQQQQKPTAEQGRAQP